MIIFDSSIVRQADIYSYSVTVTVSAGGLIFAFEVDDDDSFKLRWRKKSEVYNYEHLYEHLMSL